MTKLRQAAQAALDALESDAIQRTFAGGVRMSNAAIALRAALAQPPAPTAQPAADDWKHLLPFGYAPGNYMGICKGCSRAVDFLDKRALHCRPCAEKLHAAAQPVQQPGAEAVTLADVLDALNCFNRPKPNEDDGPWEGGHYIRVDHLPAFINVIAAAWFAPAQRQPLSEVQIHAMKCAAADQGITGIAPSLHLARAIEAAHGITAAPAAQKGEKL